MRLCLLILLVLVTGDLASAHQGRKPQPAPILPSEPAAAQTRRAIVILLTFPDADPVRPESVQWTQESTASVDAFYAEQSYGLFTLTTDTVGVYTIDEAPILAAPTDSAARIKVAELAQQAAMAAGVDLTPYGWTTLGGSCHCVYVAPNTKGVAGGRGNLTGVWISAAFGIIAPDFRPLAHELGHHFWLLHHAHSLDCDDGAPLPSRSNSCVTDEYGDTLDVMGNGLGHFNNVIKADLGWTTLALATSGDNVLDALETPDGVKGLIVMGGKSGTFTYVLEYRQPIGFDAFQPYANPANVFHGVLIRLAVEEFGTASKLLRMHPDDPAYNSVAFNQPALMVGETFCDKLARTSISVVSADPQRAIVRIGRCR